VGLTPGGVVLDLRGEINGFAKEALNAAYVEAEAKNPETILLNFEEINYINSTEITPDLDPACEGAPRSAAS
jgi:anti-anti-sigma regulatory factor